jgi:hypothetical protein
MAQPAEAESICSALESAGICIVEVPLNSPSPLESISLLSRSFGSWMLIGPAPSPSHRRCRAALKSENFVNAVGLLHLNRFFRTFGAKVKLLAEHPRAALAL